MPNTEKEIKQVVSVNIDPQQIERAVVDAIVQSAIGERIQKAIEKEIEKLKANTYSYISSEIDNVVKAEVKRFAYETIKEHEDLLSEMIREKLTKDRVQEILNDFFRKSLDKYY